jgi:hypothetical protein
MDVVKAVETYITKLVSTPSAMKVLLLDTHTVRPLRQLLCNNPNSLFSIADAHRFTCLHTIYPTFTSGLPDRSYRQQETGSYAAHEMCLFCAAK